MTADTVEHRFRQLARFWHPDNAETGNGKVFAHINVLHRAAKNKIKAGEWHFPGLLELTGTDGNESDD